MIMSDKETHTAPVEWRSSSRGSMYFWLEAAKVRGWRIHANHLGLHLRSALGVDCCPVIAFQDEAHAQHVCRRCATAIAHGTATAVQASSTTLCTYHGCMLASYVHEDAAAFCLEL